MIILFRGEHSYLSNFYKCPVIYKGMKYPSSENAFQAEKCIFETEKEIFTKIEPNESKKLGYRVNLRPDWEKVKLGIMYEILIEKFKQNPHLKDKLLATGEQDLIEGNYWHDNYWGDCSCFKCTNKTGLNRLGLTLMKVRDDLK